MAAIFLKSAVRNFILRRECMERARAAFGSQRAFMVYAARRHNQIAVAYLRDARSFA